MSSNLQASQQVIHRWNRLAARLVTAGCLLVAAAVTTTGAAQAATTERWAGPDRYATSVQISQEAFPTGADTVFLATGQRFPDALAAGPAAATLDAPILLTATDALPSTVSAELQRLNPSVIYLLGGSAAISVDVETEVDAATTADIRRVAGANRYATAAAVTELAFPTAKVVYVAAGTGFADALSAGAPGGVLKRPVLLTGKGFVPPATKAQITRLANPDIIALGGTAVVSNAVIAELDSLTTGTVRRVSGANRYATSVAVSVDAFTSADTVFLATGTTFPDALSAAPAAESLGAPILLTTTDCVPPEVIAEITRLGASRIIALGGTNAVSDAALNLTPCPVAPPTSGTPVTVTKVIDGDTIEVAQLNQPIRILGYDTPERGECGFDEATNRLTQLLASGTVTVTTDNGDDTDRFGRYLRHVLVNGVPVGLTMITEGKANARYDSLDGYPRHRYQDQYRAADGPNTFDCTTPPTSGSEPWNQPVSATNPDLDCADIGKMVIITGIDYHGLDGDGDGFGCESYG